MAHRHASLGRSTLRAIASAARGVATFIQRFRTEPALRERVLAHSVFAGILAFGAVSFDAVVTGSAPDWNPGAIAMPAAAHAQPIVSHPQLVEPSTPGEPSALTEFAADDPIELASTPVEDLLGGPDAVLASAGYTPAPVYRADPATASISVPVKPAPVVDAALERAPAISWTKTPSVS